MATSIEFMNYVCEQSRFGGEITAKKMFGEYGVYCNGKIIGLICDNQFYLKKTEFGEKFLNSQAEEASPYTNAKLHFVIESLENEAFLGELIRGTYDELPTPRSRKQK